MHRWEITGIINCVVEGVIARFAGMSNACVDQYVFNYCHLNGLDSKETSVYYYFFQSLANPRELILLFGTPIVL